ncbi:M15 family metallopeptidase [Clostridium sp.]|uniref:M15 family metallopeptidase n=1 Tax=Clostridium sp. TaxID=1506 RepID=UPI003217396C
MLNYKWKNNSHKSGKNAFYKKKDAFYRKKSGFNTGAAIIIGLLFLLGIMVGLILDGYKGNLKYYGLFNDNQDKLDINKEIQVSNRDKEKDTNKIDEVPKISISTLTDAEIVEVKQIIDNDTTGLFKLANKENLVDEYYIPNNLVTPNISLVTARESERNLVRADVVEDLEQMFYDAQQEGINLFLSNGFRGFNEQEYLHSEETTEKGSEDSEYVAKPGASEHQLGLAIDITSKSMQFELNESFEDTKEGAWALKNAYKYGFILRYTKTKENITGYSYEPWHYRYIGNRTISKLCNDKDLTLEELIDYVNDDN